MLFSLVLIASLSLSHAVSIQKNKLNSAVHGASVYVHGESRESALSESLGKLRGVLDEVQRVVDFCGTCDKEEQVRKVISRVRSTKGCQSTGYRGTADRTGEPDTCHYFGLLPDNDAPTTPPLVQPAIIGLESTATISQVTSLVTGTSSVSLRWAQHHDANVSVTVTCPSSDCTVGQPSCSHYRVALYKSPTLCQASIAWTPADVPGTVDVSLVDGASGTTVRYPIVVGSSRRRLLVVGDIGHAPQSAAVAASMAVRHAQAPADALLVAGDLSYANLDIHRWDAWLDDTMAATSLPPLAPAPGNHEMFDLMASYRARYGSTYYSVDLLGGAVHLVVLNAEELLFTHWQDQFTFLTNDLATVPDSAFVIAMWHQPWYCSNTKHEDSGWVMRDEYEKVLGKRADLVVQGHVHAYQRTTPVYQGAAGSGPVYLTVGTGGNGEGLYKSWESPAPAWDAAHDSVYGYGTLDLLNATAVHWRFYSVQDNGSDMLLDDAVILKRSL